MQVYLSPPIFLTLPKTKRPHTLATASLELKAEKQSAHSDWVESVAFSPDGKTIVSGSRDKTIKVWDANIRPFDASEWEEVGISGMEKDIEGEVRIEGLGYVGSNYWRNKVTGDLRKEYSTAGARVWALEPIKVWDAGTLAHHIPHPAQS
jgi:WD40 repeat protein